MFCSVRVTRTWERPTEAHGHESLQAWGQGPRWESGWCQAPELLEFLSSGLHCSPSRITIQKNCSKNILRSINKTMFLGLINCALRGPDGKV
jgi:hypothetical protein